MSIQSYVQMANGLNNCIWYKMPVNLQKYFILMIANAQRPVYYHGFKLIVLSLETFLDVNISIYLHFYHKKMKKKNSCNLFFSFQMIRKVFTYYMLFKTITAEWIIWLNMDVSMLRLFYKQIWSTNLQLDKFLQTFRVNYLRQWMKYR